MKKAWFDSWFRKIKPLLRVTKIFHGLRDKNLLVLAVNSQAMKIY